MEYYSAIKMNEIPAFLVLLMDLEIIMPDEISHTKRQKHQTHSLIKKKKKRDRLNFFAEQMLTHRH